MVQPRMNIHDLVFEISMQELIEMTMDNLFYVLEQYMRRNIEQGT